MIESDSVDKLDDVPLGSRMFVVYVFDPNMQATIAGATIVEPDRLDEIDSRCATLNLPFSNGIMSAAAEQVIGRMYDHEPPVGFKVKDVVEVSKRELKELIKRSTSSQTTEEDMLS